MVHIHWAGNDFQSCHNYVYYQEKKKQVFLSPILNTKIYPISRFFGGRYCSLSYGAKAPIPAGLSVFMGGWGLRPYRHVPTSRLFLPLQVNTLIKDSPQTSYNSQI